MHNSVASCASVREKVEAVVSCDAETVQGICFPAPNMDLFLGTFRQVKIQLGAIQDASSAVSEGEFTYGVAYLLQKRQ